MAGDHAGLAEVLRGLRRYPEAQAEAQAGLKLCRQLATAYPGMVSYRLELARSHSRLGMLYQAQGQLALAEAELRQAGALFKALPDDMAGAHSLLAEADAVRQNLVSVLYRRGRLAEAEAVLRENVARLEASARGSPGAAEHRVWLGRALTVLGAWLLDAGRGRRRCRCSGAPRGCWRGRHGMACAMASRTAGC
jgi:tetratricopeptide (TPR) repeat protein